MNFCMFLFLKHIYYSIPVIWATVFTHPFSLSCPTKWLNRCHFYLHWGTSGVNSPALWLQLQCHAVGSSEQDGYQGQTQICPNDDRVSSLMSPTTLAVRLPPPGASIMCACCDELLRGPWSTRSPQQQHAYSFNGIRVISHPKF